MVTHASWRWLFWVNAPLGLFAAWRLYRLPRGTRNEAAPGVEDIPGLLLFSSAAAGSLLWVSQAGHRFAWLSAECALLAGCCALLWALLVWRERRHSPAFLPVELLRQPAITCMALTIVCFASCMFAMVFFLPVYLQLGHSISAAHAGLLVLPLTFGMVTGSTSTGRIISKFGKPKWLPVIGMSLSSLALLLMSLLPPVYWLASGLGFFCGLGFGTVMPTSQVVIQTLAGRDRLGIASATTSLARATGSALGTALFGALVFALLRGVDVHDAARLSTLSREAVVAAFRHGFFAAALLAALGAWLASRVPQTQL